MPKISRDSSIKFMLLKFGVAAGVLKPAASAKVIKDDPYRGLFQHVGKSELVNLLEHPEFLKVHSDKIIVLGQQIRAGNTRHTLFTHPLAEIFIYYLVKKNMISYEEAINSQLYLLVLAQFTKSRQLRREDKDTKIILNKPIEVLSLVDTDNMEVKDYLKHLAEVKDINGRQLNLTTLLKSLVEMPASSKWLFKIILEIDTDISKKQRSDVFDFLRIGLGRNLPFIQVQEAEGCTQVLFPSHSMLCLLLDCINPELRIEAIPTLGQLSSRTLLALHNRRSHPLALYSNYVKSNIKIIHGRRCGAIPAYLHDILHIYMAKQFTVKQFDFIFDYLIPLLTEINRMYAADEEMTKLCGDAIEKLSDIDLTFFGGLIGFNSFLCRGLNLYETSKNEFKQVGDCKEDELFFLLQKNLEKDRSKITDCFGAVPQIARSGGFHRDQTVYKLIGALSKGSRKETLREEIKAHTTLLTEIQKNLLKLLEDDWRVNHKLTNRWGELYIEFILLSKTPVPYLKRTELCKKLNILGITDAYTSRYDSEDISFSTNITMLKEFAQRLQGELQASIVPISASPHS